MHPSRSESALSSGPPKVSPKLGELLLEMGLVSPMQLQAALDQQKQDGRRLGSILVDQGIINETRLVKALSRQLGIEVCDPITAPVHEMVRSKISHRSARDLRVVPIALKKDPSGDRLFVATSDPLNSESRHRLQKETSMRVEWLLAGETELELALARHYGTQRPSFVLESLPPAARSSSLSASVPPLVSEEELDLAIPMEAPVDVSFPPDVSLALEPLPDDSWVGAPQIPSRTLSHHPTPDLIPPNTERRSSSPARAVPGALPSWGEIVSKPPTDPSGVLLGSQRAARSELPPRGPAAPARPSEDPYIEAVEHIAMTGDLLPPSRVLRSSAGPGSLSAPPRAFNSSSVPMPSSWSAAPHQLAVHSAPVEARGESAEAASEPPLLDLSEVDILPLESEAADARGVQDALTELGLPTDAGSEAPQPSDRSPVSDLSGLDLESIASALSDSVESADAVELMVSSPPPQPTPEQEVRVLAAQVHQEIKDLIAGEANAEARTRVLRTLVAVLEDEGFFSEARLQRAVRRALLG